MTAQHANEPQYYDYSPSEEGKMDRLAGLELELLARIIADALENFHNKNFLFPTIVWHANYRPGHHPFHTGGLADPDADPFWVYMPTQQHPVPQNLGGTIAGSSALVEEQLLVVPQFQLNVSVMVMWHPNDAAELPQHPQFPHSAKRNGFAWLNTAEIMYRVCIANAEFPLDLTAVGECLLLNGGASARAIHLSAGAWPGFSSRNGLVYKDFMKYGTDLRDRRALRYQIPEVYVFILPPKLTAPPPPPKRFWKIGHRG